MAGLLVKCVWYRKMNKPWSSDVIYKQCFHDLYLYTTHLFFHIIPAQFCTPLNNTTCMCNISCLWVSLISVCSTIKYTVSDGILQSIHSKQAWSIQEQKLVMALTIIYVGALGVILLRIWLMQLKLTVTYKLKWFYLTVSPTKYVACVTVKCQSLLTMEVNVHI